MPAHDPRPWVRRRSKAIWRGVKHKPAEVLVGLASLVVAGAAVYVAIQANHISERQNEIQARQLQPVITANLDYGVEHGRATSQTLTVRNVGGAATGVGIDVATLLQVGYEHGATSVQRDIPVANYYSGITLTGAPTGVLGIATGGRNNDAEMRLERDSLRYASLHHESLLLRFQQDVRVAYRDVLGEQHTDYLSVDVVGGTTVLSGGRGRSVFAQQNDPAKELDLTTATPQRLVALVD